MKVLAMHTNSCGRWCPSKQSPFSILGIDQVALEPARVLADDRKGSGCGSSDAAMIEVLAGTDPESHVADAGTVKVSSVGDVICTTKASQSYRYHLPPTSPTTTTRTYYGAHECNSDGHPQQGRNPVSHVT